jgi:phosphoribosyl 1,2-cyclic phosphodiesterase
MDLEPVSWDWDRRDGTMDGKKDSGFVAQEVDEVIQDWEAEDILPSLLNKNNNEAWEVGNAALIPVLVKAIQELKKELDSCKAGK